MTISPRDWLAMLALAAMVGGGFTVSKMTVAELPPLTLTALRVGFAAIFFTIILGIAGQRMPYSLTFWRRMVPLSALNLPLPFILIFWAQQEISGGLTGIINTTAPLFTVLVAHFTTTDDKLSPGRAVGLLFGMAGVAAMIGPSLLGQLGGHALSELAALSAAFLFACGSIYGRRFRGASPLQLVAGQMYTSAIFMIPIALLIDQPWTKPLPSQTVILLVIGLSLFPTCLGYLTFFSLLRRIGATNVMLTAFLHPVFAILVGIIFLNESLVWNHLLGMVLLAIGLAAVDGRIITLLKRQSIPKAGD